MRKQGFLYYSLLITVPVVVGLCIVTFNTLTRYYQFAVRYERTPITYTLHETALYETRHLLRSVHLGLTGKYFFSDGNSQLKEINLFVSESGINKLDSNLPYSGFEYIEGAIKNGDKLQKIKYRYRGDLPNHWAEYKKSIRIKTKKKNLFNGMRSFNLIAPKADEMFHTYLGLKLAQQFDLIVPLTEMVNVNLNGYPQGVHVLVEQIEELTLRRSGVMPGDLYAGELFSKDKITGISSNIFNHPGIWKKIAINNHFEENSYAPLAALLEVLNAESSEENHKKLSQLLDMNAWGRFAAFETLAQTFHYDDDHNWRLYYDPWRTQFVPVIWDPTAWMWLPKDGGKAIPDTIASRLHIKLMENGDYLKARHSAIENFYSKGLDKEFILSAREVAAKLANDIQFDPHFGRMTNRKDTDSEQNPNKAIALQSRFIDQIVSVFADIKQEYVNSPTQLVYTRENNLLQLLVEGRKPVKSLMLNFEQGITDIKGITISYWQNGKQVERDIMGASQIRGNKIEFNLGLLANFVMHESTVRVPRKLVVLDKAYYQLRFDGLTSDNPLVEVLYGVNSAEMAAAKNKLIAPQFINTNMYQLTKAEPLSAPLIWQGEVILEGLNEVNQLLIIRPGTTVKLKSGAALILHNRLIADGNANSPIRFISEDPESDPWGTIALKGRGANGSRLSHCEFIGGSGIKSDLYEYSAMFSVHDVKNVTVSYCNFKDSKIVDDMVHTVYSTIQFSHSNFIRANSDAVDLDISEATIDSSNFINSGNDAIDLMTTEAIVTNSTFRNNGDKGISVGEGSGLLAVNNSFVGNEIAVQAKDGSKAYLYNADIVDNKLPLNAYKKNWRYGNGGRIYTDKSRLMNNGAFPSADKKSKIYLYDSFVDDVSAKNDKHVYVDKSVDSKERDRAVSGVPSVENNVFGIINDADISVLKTINWSRRGAEFAN